MCSFAETTHTPQGDGNKPSIISSFNLLRNNPHPARGRKPYFSYWYWSCRWYETTHTPQGDGNQHDDVIACTLQRNNPHPARGRKHHSNTTSRAPCYRNNPHPARGRKPSHFALQTLHPRNNPHPARGRKLPRPEPKDSQDGNNPHPARGRKLSCRPYPHFLSGNDPHPARGRKPRAIRISSISEETTHTPQGDGNLHPVGKPINHSKQPTPRKGTET